MKKQSAICNQQSAIPPAAKPLLKWAGGKRQLLPRLRPFYPSTFNRYIEPFFGSGAVFFDLHAAGRLRGHDAVLIDSNADLVGSLMPASWNQIAAWLQQLDGLRHAA